MKLLITSDWHLDAKTAGVSRFDDINRAISQTIDQAIEHNVDVFAFLGDLMDPDVGAVNYRALMIVLDTMRRLHDVGITTLWVVGNHDVIHDPHGTSTLHPLLGLDSDTYKVFPGQSHLVFRPGPFKLHCRDGTSFDCLGLPYPSMNFHYDPVKVAESLHTNPLVFSHLNIEGMVPGEESVEYARGKDVFLPWAQLGNAKAIFNGHYHQGQVYSKEGRVPIHIPGSLARLTFGEERGTPSFMICEV